MDRSPSFLFWDKQTVIKDGFLFIALIVLVAFGAAVHISIAQGGDSARAIRQLVYVGLGIVLFLIATHIETHRLRTASLVWYGTCFALLALVLIFGSSIRGTRGWFSLGFVSFQPVELMKLGLVVVLAAFFERSRFIYSQWKRFVISFVIAILPIGLVLLQPDAGSSLVLGAIWLMLAITQLDRRKVLFLIFVAIVIFGISWVTVIKDYQKERILVLMNPAADPYGIGYNTRQSVIAIGSGKFFGRGIGEGSQGHLRFLPEAATDFPFAVIAEEMGFVGSVTVLVSFAFLIVRIIYIVRHARDDYSAYFAYGVSVWFFTQTAINIGMNLGLLPVIGVPLPFISYGGSALLVSCLALGLVGGIATLRRV